MFDQLFNVWPTLVGIALLITVIINILKMFNVVVDGTADKWSAGLNLLGLVTLYVYTLFKPDADIVLIDKNISEFASVMMIVVTYVMQLGGSKFFNWILRGLPWIGTRLSPPKIE